MDRLRPVVHFAVSRYFVVTTTAHSLPDQHRISRPRELRQAIGKISGAVATSRFPAEGRIRQGTMRVSLSGPWNGGARRARDSRGPDSAADAIELAEDTPGTSHARRGPRYSMMR